MEHLPNEILILICNELTDGEIINLPFHLTSRGLSRKDARRRFHHLFASWNQTKLKQLVRIAANPGLRDAVTKISFCTETPKIAQAEPFMNLAWLAHVRTMDLQGIFFSTRAPSGLSFDNFHTMFGRAESDCCFCHNLSLKAQFLRCNLRYQAWNKWQRSGQSKSLLALAVAWLPNLKTICIDNSRARYLAVREEFIYGGIGDPSYLIDPHCWDCSRDFDGGSKLFKRLVKAVSTAQQMDRSFRTMSNSKPSFYKVGNVYLMLGDLLLTVAPDAVHATFEKLTCLEMTSVHRNHKGLMYHGLICACSSEAAIPITFYDASWPYMIKAPRNLISLKINVWDGSVFYPFHLLQLDNFGLSYSKPQCSISRLELVGFSIPEVRLSTFLQSTVQTLQHLGLDQINLSSGTWVGLFDQLGGQFDLKTLKLGLLSNTGEDIEAITGYDSPNILLMDHEAEANLLNWLRGWADFHCVRLLMPEYAPKK